MDIIDKNGLACVATGHGPTKRADDRAITYFS